MTHEKENIIHSVVGCGEVPLDRCFYVFFFGGSVYASTVHKEFVRFAAHVGFGSKKCVAFPSGVWRVEGGQQCNSEAAWVPLRGA